MRLVLAAALLLSGVCAPALRAQEVSSRTYTLKDGSTLTYQKPGFWHTMGSGPSDLGLFFKESFKKESLPWVAAVGASTLILIAYDQRIYTGSKKIGKKLGLSGKDKTRTYLKANGVSLFRGPSDLGSALYFLGDGWINIGLFAYFETRALLDKNDWRAAQTGHQLAEGLVFTGVVTQVIKRVTGRETPSGATAAGGVWRMFPSFAEFKEHRSRYDAVPSGHLATGMMSIMVIAENYPEKKFVKPLGYALLAGLSFQMMNNGVHWASDYPLGLAIGYGIGKAIASGGRTAAKRGGPAPAPSVKLLPYLSPEGGPGALLACRF